MFEGTRLREIGSVLLAVGLLGFGSCERKAPAPVTVAEPAPVVAPAPTSEPPLVTTTPAPPAPAPAPEPPPTPKAAEPNTFAEVTERLDQGGGLFFYLSTEQWLKSLSDSVGMVRDLATSAPAAQQDAKEREQTERWFKLLTNLVKKSGLEDITGIGGSSFAIEPGLYRNKLFVHHHKGNGTGFVWRAIGKEPRPMTLLQCLPANTAFATSSDLNLGEFLGAILKEIDQAEIFEARMMRDQLSLQLQAATGMTIDEALTAFGDSISLVVTLDPEAAIQVPMDKKPEAVPRPALALLLETPDDRIFKQVTKSMGNNPQLIKVDEPGLTMRTMVIPIMPQFGVRLTFAQWGSYFIAASDDALVRAMIDAQTSGQGFVATPEFVKLTEGLPAEGNGFSVTTKLFAETVSRLQETMLKNQPAVPAEQQAMLQKIMSMQQPAATYSVTAHVENGWLTVSKGSQGASQLMAPLVVAPVAVGAGILFPMVGTVKQRSQKSMAAESANRAKQIGLACHLYAAENNGKFPPKLEALVPKYLSDKDLLKSPFKPEEAIGYKYTPGLTTDSPADKVLLEDKFASEGKQRVVGKVDGSVTTSDQGK